MKPVSLTFRECVLGDRAFYRKVWIVVLPMIIQNTLTNIVNLLDNVMVGQTGTLPMSAVAIVGQLIFVFYLAIFGGVAGAGIYGAQYFGSGDYEGMRNTLRFKFVFCLMITAAAVVIFYIFGETLIGNFIAEDTSLSDRIVTLNYAGSYMNIMLIGLVPYTITQCYAGTLRESGKTSLPMKAGVVAMLTNFVFNSLLIFGLLGFPKLGVTGAAIATVISRFVEMLIVIIFAHRNKRDYGFLSGLYRTFRIPGDLIRKMIIKSLPMLLNELLWALGQTILMQCLSMRGISVVAAANISFTVSQIFQQVYMSFGNANLIMVGQELGANRLVNARRTAWRYLVLMTVVCAGMGVLLALVSPFIPLLYNTESNIRTLATQLMLVTACCLPLYGCDTSEYFTLRAGGRTGITFAFDSCFSWIVMVPTAYLLIYFTDMSALSVYAIVCGADLLKCIIGFALVKKGGWVRNLVAS